jgi:hypothetical protein
MVEGQQPLSPKVADLRLWTDEAEQRERTHFVFPGLHSAHCVCRERTATCGVGLKNGGCWRRWEHEISSGI